MQKNLHIEKIIFKVVQIKFLAMHINNKNMFMIGNVLNIFIILISNDFWHKIKMYNVEPYNVLFYTHAAYDCVCAAGTHVYGKK